MAKKKVKTKGKNINVHVKIEQKSKKGDTLKYTLIALAVIVFIGVVAFADNNFGPLTSIFGGKAKVIDKVVAIVNGENIYESEVLLQYQGLAQQYGSKITKELVLNQTIIERILLQEAKKGGISVSDTEINSFVEESLTTSGTTLDAFKLSLKTQNMTFEQVTERVKIGLVLEKFFKQDQFKIEIPEEEIKGFYEDKKNLLGNTTYEEAKEQISTYLESQRQTEVMQSYITNVRQGANVQILEKVE